jgi:membrane fusion protein (multidrug efflux system)
MSTVAVAKSKTSGPGNGAADDVETDEFPVGNDLSSADDIVSPPIPLAAPPRRGRKRRIALAIVALLAVGGGIAAALYWMQARNFESTDDATVEARVIAISPQLAARVKTVHIADNALVHKGDVLVELDPTDYQVALEQAEASEAAVRGRLAQAMAQVDSACASRDQAVAEVAVAQSNQDMAALDNGRYIDAQKLGPGAVSKQQLDNAAGALKSMIAQSQQASAKLTAARAQIVTAQAAVQGAQGDLSKATADVHRAKVNLSYCTITAPEDGRVTRKSVEAGSYVQTGQNLLAIVPPDYWVVANFKETQLDRVRPGQRVKITIDAYPGKDFAGWVDSIQSGTGARFSVLPAENATGNYVKVVQRVPVKIMFDPGPGAGPASPAGAGDVGGAGGES